MKLRRRILDFLITFFSITSFVVKIFKNLSQNRNNTMIKLQQVKLITFTDIHLIKLTI